MKKAICMMLALIAVLSFSLSSFASTGSFIKSTVYGGASQIVTPSNCSKDELNTMDVHISSLNLNSQSGFKFRGYDAATNSPCTYAKTITATGYRGATYTSSPAKAYMKMSISSTSSSDFVTFSGTYAI